MVWSVLYVIFKKKGKQKIYYLQKHLILMVLILQIWHEEYQDNSADLTIPNASSDSGLTDINMLKDPPAIFLYLPK